MNSLASRTSTLRHWWLSGVCLLGIQLSASAETVYLGSPKHAGKSMDAVDHSRWDALLAKYVNEEGRVDYAAWKASDQDVHGLGLYLKELSSVDLAVSAKREARLAFWINAYNAVTVRGILREYPTTSIRNHTPRLFGYHIWKDLQLYVGGQPHSLDQIEHEILRKMSEPRIHFAIVCASISCPRLLNDAYTGDELESQLEANSEDFFARKQNFRFDAANQRFYLSAILDWFGEDFGSSQAEVLKRIAVWLPSDEAKQAAKSNAVSVSYLDYDWNLNKQ